MGNVTTDFVTATKKLHADVRAILTTVRLIGNDVKAIHDERGGNAHHNKTNKKHPAAGTFDSAQKEEESYEAKQYTLDKERFTLDKNVFKVGKWSLGVVAIYTLLTGYQACQTRKSADDAHLTLIMDQRPWIKIHWGSPPYDFDISPQGIRQKLGLINVGKSPVLNVWMHAAMEKVKGRDKPRFDFKDQSIGQTGIMFPDQVPVVFPIATSGADEIEKQQIDLQQILVFSYGWVRYDDNLGNTYWQQFCNWNDSTGISPSESDIARKICVEYNQEGTQKH